MNGFLIHPWDLFDEGAVSVYDNLRELGFNAVFVGINSIAEKHPPYPVKAKLSHNPRRVAHISEKGTYYYKFNEHTYDSMHFPLQKTIAPNVEGRDVLEEATKNKEDFDMRVYAWVKVLSNDYLAEQTPEYSVCNILGERNEQWICFINPNVRKFQIELIKEIVSKYNVDGILLDSIQYVYPYINLIWLHRGFNCFCEHCQIAMDEFGINVNTLKEELFEFHESIKTFSLKQLEKFKQFDLGDIKAFFYDKKEIYKWIYFKFKSLNEFIGEIYRTIKEQSQKKELGVCMWSPRSSWLVSQSYKMITNNCDWIMPMLYRRVWGYYTLKMVDELKKNVKDAKFREKAAGKLGSELLDMFFKFNNFSGPKELFKLRHGIDSNIITSELDEINSILNNSPLSYNRQDNWGIAHKIRYILENPSEISARFKEFEFPEAKKVPIYPSLELWDPATGDPTPPMCLESVKSAEKSTYDGFIFQSYGWAPMQNIYAASDHLKSKGGTND